MVSTCWAWSYPQFCRWNDPHISDTYIAITTSSFEVDIIMMYHRMSHIWSRRSSGVARNLQRGWPGVRVPTVGRAAAAGRPKARSAVGRPGGSGRGSPPPVKGVRGCHPRENFEIVYSKLCILVHFLMFLSCLTRGLVYYKSA